MKLNVTRTDVWAAEIDDKPGGLAMTLRAIADFGADLDCVVARRMPDKPGKGVVFITPLHGKEQLENADQVGFHPTHRVSTLKIEGTNEPAAGAMIAKAIGEAGVSMHGLSAAVIGRKFVCYAGFDSVEDMAKAETALKNLSTGTHWPDWHPKFRRKESGKSKAVA